MDKFKYQCVTCNKIYRENEVLYLCPECNKLNSKAKPQSGILKTIYPEIQSGFIASLSKSEVRRRFDALKMNNFIDILPIANINSFPKLRIGETPLYHFDKLNGTKLPARLSIKDDSQNPTYSFKDRASALVSAYAKEKGINTVVVASTGNAGSSMAGICASQNQKAIVLVPETAPMAKIIQILMYGASLITLKGTYDDAYDLSVKASEKFGWYNRNTAYNPLTIEGKKTVSFEIFEQLNYSIPSRIFVPTGDGVILSGIYKGFEDLQNCGIIDKIPVIVAVQANGSDNLARNIGKSEFIFVKSKTIADSISVDVPRNFYMACRYIQNYGGEIITVSDAEITEASSILSRNTGLFAEPASAAAFAGFLSYLNNYKLKDGSINVVLHTGSGLKDLNAVENKIKIPESISPTLKNLEKFYGTLL